MVKDKVECMVVMRDWFMGVRKTEGMYNRHWRLCHNSSREFLTTYDIINHLIDLIFKYEGRGDISIEENDRISLNIYREFYNINRGNEVGSIITTI